MTIITFPQTNTHAIKRQAPPNPHPNPDLFDTLHSWLETPALAYASWLERQRLKDSTKTVYLAMFNRFCEWLDQSGKRLDRVGAEDIRLFLDTENPNLPESRRRANSGRQRQQYVRQLELVFAHLGTLGYQGENAGSKAGHQRVGRGSDKPTRFLNDWEIRTLIRHIQTRLDELRREEKGEESWMEYRDLALVSVMIGGGLKLNQVVRLTLNCMNMAERRIDLSKLGHAHRARILSFAMPPLETWLSIQKQGKGEGDGNRKLFEADKTLGFARLSKTTTIAPSSVHRRTQRLLSQAGIDGERASAQTLRNTYAALLIEGGADDEQLIDYLGLQASVTAQRLRATYANFLKTTRPNYGLDATQLDFTLEN